MISSSICFYGTCDCEMNFLIVLPDEEYKCQHTVYGERGRQEVGSRCTVGNGGLGVGGGDAWAVQYCG